ncbi:hypothetical protein N7532_001489 [Penicillium argentinense]|uniref:Uncharacterized protein n=1 Tax=Penicillium argentinense TaxID=1131581 RepID=A0A9W9KLA8_9EURO|nr:uncharacterized protein N7532_001489 [Penicillium argentinense]KAJ5110954.1 hypothetical protein N7532_001489 [Penicillium argentinense]
MDVGAAVSADSVVHDLSSSRTLAEGFRICYVPRAVPAFSSALPPIHLFCVRQDNRGLTVNTPLVLCVPAADIPSTGWTMRLSVCRATHPTRRPSQKATIWSHVRRYVSWFNRSIDAASRGQEEPTDELPMVPCDECAMLFAVTEFITPSGQHVLQCPYCRNRQLRRYYDERLN